MPDLRRGEIWYVDWSPGRGSEQTGLRPSLVVQSDAPNTNERYQNTIVVTISEHGRDIPSHVVIEAGADNELAYDSYAKCEQVMTISKERLVRRVGKASPDEMVRVDRALRRMLTL